ncbi:Acylneuraminate cytidylyltransferase [Candidatus Protochlamydia naegleriophila]|uniref:Acylneuraminate cytidylyltransferase n=1 Tax=Candidatus Protochlamydia naegleriophila TaxID=389348 RepID=A0A0U5JE24_9BACT|nr:glycosyltransferase family protein [Candidatus Protochlamydia naegleriophila]CUI16639.1 Acylneuraminate cytidylyltransferase [Candidatus Protochlamydia naegleriophila]
MRVEIFVQARMGSTRLPGKILQPVFGKPLLKYIVERLREVKNADEIVVLTTTEASDDIVEDFCQKEGVACFRGSENDVLERYYQAALQRRPDAIVRVTADCPLIDPEIVDAVIDAFKRESPAIDYISNSLKRTYPRGLDVEIFSFEALKKAYQLAIKPEEREHVTVYLYRHPELFKLKNMAHHPSLSQYRWTVDTQEDFTLIRLILEHLYPDNPTFRLQDVLNLLKKYPEWNLINAHIEQKKVS